MDDGSTTQSGSAGLEAEESSAILGLTILWHPDSGRVGERAPLTGLLSGREERLTRTEPAFGQPRGSVLRPLGDVHLSRRPLRFVPGRVEGSVRLLTDGAPTAVETGGVEIGPSAEFAPADVDRGVVLLLAGRIVLLLHRYDPLAGAAAPPLGLVGESGAIARLREEVLRVADLAVPILLQGESGTGKELVAQAIHEAGSRRGRAYLTVNLGAIPPTLAAAELFGAAKGAYTGAASDRPGYFVRANGGTLFLDEIGEASPEVQVLLLRAFETGEIQTVGGDRPQRVNVRLIAATDADLEAAAAAGRFRAPLLHRLGAYAIRLPALRERREDVGRLLVHFLREELSSLGEGHRLRPRGPRDRPWLSARLAARLAEHEWPGNVRQLRNVVRRLAIAGRGSHHVPEDEIDQWMQDGPRRDPTRPAGVATRSRHRSARDIGEEELLAALRAHRWRLQPTALQLGIARSSLYDLIDRSPGIRKAADLPRSDVESAVRRLGTDLDALAESLEVSRKGLARRLRDLGLI
jgi:two-component system, NtrC family, nitrogen regulation response regulator GlnG